MQIYMKASDKFFDSVWATASVHLLTDIANRLSAIPNEVLVLQPKAFGPTSWEYADQVRLFKPHFETPPEREVWTSTSKNTMKTCQDMLNMLAEKEVFGPDDWEMDFSSTYVLHAIDGEYIRGWDNKVDLDYILARQSNYARPVDPAIARATESGAILKRVLAIINLHKLINIQLAISDPKTDSKGGHYCLNLMILRAIKEFALVYVEN